MQYMQYIQYMQYVDGQYVLFRKVIFAAWFLLLKLEGLLKTHADQK